MSDLDKLREIYLADDVEDDIRKENFEEILNFEKQLREIDDFARWSEHPVTKMIVAQAKKTYIDHSLLLARSRELTESARLSLWAKQDAMLWLISLTTKNLDNEKRGIEMQIKRVLELS